MSPMEIEQEELEIFLDEMDELLQILEEDILKLEKQPDNPSILHEIFRAAHTIKGSAGSIGFMTLSELAHSMETVFDRVRSGNMRVSMPLVDEFLRCVDTLQKIKDQISSEGDIDIDISAHLEALGGLAEQTEEQAPEEPDVAPEPEPLPPEMPTQCIKLSLDAREQCLMPFVRALQALSFFSELGDILTSSPTMKEIEREESAFPLSMVVRSTAGRDKIDEIMALLDDLALFECYKVDDGQAAAAELDGQAAPQPEPPASQPPEPAQPEPAPSPVQQEPPPPEPREPDAQIEASPEEPHEEPPEENDAPEKATPSPAAGVKKRAPRTVRVDVERMDTIMDLVGELVINRTRLTQLSRSLETEHDSDEEVEFLNETSDNIELISTQLQENIMKARLLPIENVFNKFPRMVRDLANKSKKEIDLVIEGEKTELDRSVLEEIGDPLMHILRNSVDHGIESPEQREAAGKPRAGKIRIAASHIEDHIQITVEDDGRGIDRARVLDKARANNIASPEVLAALKDKEVLDLVFAPGFSTADTVSEVSGRGVGMDVVRTNIEKLNGNVTLFSDTGRGTRVLIKLPLTLAIIKSLLVTLEHRIFAVPLVSVVQTLRVDVSELKAVKGRETILFRGAVLPLIRLEDVFDIQRAPGTEPPKNIFIVVVSWAGRKTGLIVDALIGDQEIVIRPLGEYIGEVPGVSGAAILGDGRITLIVDVGGIVQMKLRDIQEAAGGAV